MSLIAEHLAELGVSDSLLSDEQQEFLDRRGYLTLPGALDGPTVEALRRRVDELVVDEGDRAGIEVHQEAGTARLANLLDKDPLFDRCWNYPPLLAAMAQLFRGAPFKLCSVNSRAALPGQGHQQLHADWKEPVQAGAYQACNSVMMLDAFTEENGATRVVPGSHRFARLPQEAMADRFAPHPDQVLLLGAAGTCVVFNSHIWHGGTLNRSSEPRRAVHSSFILRDHPQQTVQRDYLSAATLSRMSRAQRYLLEV